MQVGDVGIARCIDIDPFDLPVSLLFPGADLDALRPHADRLAPDHVDFGSGSIRLGVQSHLVRVDRRTILVDTCVGEHKERPRRAEWHRRHDTGFLQRLRALGVSPESIDVVLCTHLHADHVGWNTRLEDGRWVPTFPRARYLVSRRELAATEARLRAEPGEQVSHGCFADSVAPVLEAGQFDLVDDGHDVARGVVIEPLPGHTTGQVGLRIARGGQEALLCGDAVHSPVQVYRPDWCSRFDDDPAQARATRERLFAAIADTGVRLVPNHLRRAPALLVRGGAGGGFEPAFCSAGGDAG